MAGNELALVGGEISAKTVSEALTLQLEDTLLRAPDAKEAAKSVVASPKLLAEAREKMKLVSRLASPIGKEALYIAIQPLVIMFNAPDFGQGEDGSNLQIAWFDLFSEALKEHPKEAIDIAVHEWLRVGKPFFPKPTELNALAQEASDEIRLIAFRLRMAVERSDKLKPTPKRTPEDGARIKAIVEEMKGPDGKIVLGAAKDMNVIPRSNRRAAAEALRRLRGSL